MRFQPTQSPTRTACEPFEPALAVPGTFGYDRARAHPEIETQLFDPRKMVFPMDDEGQELKNLNPEWRDAIIRAGGLCELGLIVTFTDLNFANVESKFDSEGRLIDPEMIPRIDRFFTELVWMARTLCLGRANLPSKYHEQSGDCRLVPAD